VEVSSGEVITFDWLEISSPEKFYELFFSLVGAPEWHGDNLNALYDSIVIGQINKLRPPFIIENINVSETHGEMKNFQKMVLDIFVDAAVENSDIETIVR